MRGTEDFEDQKGPLIPWGSRRRARWGWLRRVSIAAAVLTMLYGALKASIYLAQGGDGVRLSVVDRDVLPLAFFPGPSQDDVRALGGTGICRTRLTVENRTGLPIRSLDFLATLDRQMWHPGRGPTNEHNARIQGIGAGGAVYVDLFSIDGPPATGPCLETTVSIPRVIFCTTALNPLPCRARLEDG
ncbi:MAG: hypothetical protein AAFY66_13935 [Pseudomonadota bacterium]